MDFIEPSVVADILNNRHIKWPNAFTLEADEFSDQTRHLIQGCYVYLTDDQCHQAAVKIWRYLRGE